jgi:hypothetical protein
LNQQSQVAEEHASVVMHHGQKRYEIGASDHSSYQPQVSHSKSGSKVVRKEEQKEHIPNGEKNKAKNKQTWATLSLPT